MSELLLLSLRGVIEDYGIGNEQDHTSLDGDQQWVYSTNTTSDVRVILFVINKAKRLTS